MFILVQIVFGISRDVLYWGSSSWKMKKKDNASYLLDSFSPVASLSFSSFSVNEMNWVSSQSSSNSKFSIQKPNPLKKEAVRSETFIVNFYKKGPEMGQQTGNVVGT